MIRHSRHSSPWLLSCVARRGRSTGDVHCSPSDVFDGLVDPGFYRLDNKAFADVHEMEVVIHERHPHRWTSTVPAVKKNPEDKPMRALLLSMDVPAVAVTVAYIDDGLTDGVWEGRWSGETNLAFKVEVISIADDS